MTTRRTARRRPGRIGLLAGLPATRTGEITASATRRGRPPSSGLPLPREHGSPARLLVSGPGRKAGGAGLPGPEHEGVGRSSPPRGPREPPRAEATWHAVAAGDPDPERAHRLLDERGPIMTPPWWDEHSDEGWVVLGAVLGYPPARTYARLTGN